MNKSSRLHAILQACLVAFLWSTSWVLIKWFLGDIPPLTYAGLRYVAATLIMLPGLRKYTQEVKALSKPDWMRLISLGVVYYAVAQGGQYLALANLDAITVSMLLNFTTILVAVFSIVFLHEVPSWLQWLGLAVFLSGVYLYFAPLTEPQGSWLGYVYAMLCLGANAVGMVISRALNRQTAVHPYVVTVIGMGIGGGLMLAGGLLFSGLGTITWQGALAILWLASVNTAFGYLLWNKAMRHLTAVESSNINNTMLIWIAVLAWIFLGERPTPVDILGLALSMVGIFLVQMKRMKAK